MRIFKKVMPKSYIDFGLKSVAYLLILVALKAFIERGTDFYEVHGAWHSLTIAGFAATTQMRFILFLVASFLLVSRHKIRKFVPPKFSIPVFVIFGSISFLFAYFLRLFILTIISSQTIINENYYILLFLKFFLPVVVMFTLFVALFNFNTLVFLWKKLKVEAVVSAGSSALFMWLVNIYQTVWPYFSRAVIEIVIFLFRFGSFDVHKNLADLSRPLLTVNHVSLIIAKGCSGIESQMLFILLYALIVFIDWKEIIKWRAVLLFLPGVIGMFLMNALRIYFLYLVAIYFSVDFAIRAFHTNAGWIIFVLYFVSFQYFTYSWLRKK
jgi:exosortase/archaeosortase family protein